MNEAANIGSPRRPGLWLALILVALGSGGAWLTFWTARQADAEMRDRLLAQANAVARQVNAAHVNALAFHASDKANPRFQRLRSQMTAYAREALPLFGPQTKYLGLYSMARRGSDFLFGPESIDENDSRASPPGTRYEQAPAEAASDATTRLPGGTETLLLVEDEESVRRVTAAVLKRSGYRVREAGRGEEALALWEKQGGEVDLLLTDLVMPGELGGLELAERLLQARPGLLAILMSGYSAELMAQGMGGLPGTVFLQKPLTPAVLLNTVRKSLDERRP